MCTNGFKHAVMNGSEKVELMDEYSDDRNTLTYHKQIHEKRKHDTNQ